VWTPTDVNTAPDRIIFNAASGVDAKNGAEQRRSLEFSGKNGHSQSVEGGMTNFHFAGGVWSRRFAGFHWQIHVM
jgi:hypothetical protein